MLSEVADGQENVSAEFKREEAKLALQPDAMVSKIAQDLGLSGSRAPLIVRLPRKTSTRRRPRQRRKSLEIDAFLSMRHALRVADLLVVESLRVGGGGGNRTSE